jgi:hypothetical protein
MPFIKLKGVLGRVFVPEKVQDSEKKYPCADCFDCQWCDEERCRVCRKRVKCGKCGKKK